MKVKIKLKFNRKSKNNRKRKINKKINEKMDKETYFNSTQINPFQTKTSIQISLINSNHKASND